MAADVDESQCRLVVTKAVSGKFARGDGVAEIRF